MKAALVLGSFVSALSLTGCFDDLLTTTVTFSDDAAATVELEFEIAGECTGSGERAAAGGIARWTKTPVGEGETAACRVDVTWDGDLISLTKMRDDTIAECGEGNDKCNPDELDLELSIKLESAWFDAGAERMEREQLLEMSSRATTGDATLFTLDKTTTLPLDLGPDPAVKAQLKQAYLVSGSLAVHAEGSITLSMLDVRRLQEGSPDGVLSIGFSSHLAGSIEAHL